MHNILLIGTTRPGLAAALSRRGLHLVTTGPTVAVAAIWIAPPLPYPVGRVTMPLLLVIDGDDDDVAAALDAGAADAVSGSSASILIAARMAALVRRSPRGGPLRVGDLTIDRVERRAVRGGHHLALLPREYALLLHLALHAGRVVTRAALREAVWGLDFDPGTNVIEVHVSRLRAKLDRGFATPMLLTEKGAGYRLVAVPSAGDLSVTRSVHAV